MNSATVNITIKDVNNKVPVLGELPLLHTGENVAVGTELYRIQGVFDCFIIISFYFRWNTNIS